MQEIPFNSSKSGIIINVSICFSLLCCSRSTHKTSSLHTDAMWRPSLIPPGYLRFYPTRSCSSTTAPYALSDLCLPAHKCHVSAGVQIKGQVTHKKTVSAQEGRRTGAPGGELGYKQRSYACKHSRPSRLPSVHC